MVFFDSAEVQVLKVDKQQQATTPEEPPVVEVPANSPKEKVEPLDPVVDWSGYYEAPYCCYKQESLPTVEHMVCICVGVALGYFVTKILTTVKES